MEIAIGSTVTWHELPLDRRFTMRIVRPQHMKPDRIGKDLPANSPIAKAIIGLATGDVVEVDTPVGTKTVTIMEVT